MTRKRTLTPRSVDIAAALERARRALGVGGAKEMMQSSTGERLRASVVRRVVLLATATALITLFRVTHLASIPGATFTTLLIWLIAITIAAVVVRAELSGRAFMRVHSVLYVSDTVIGLAFAHTLGAVYWMSPLLMGMSIAFGAQTSPRRNALALALVSSAGYAGMLTLEHRGILPATGPFASITPPTTAAAVAAVVLVTVMLFQTATIQHTFNKQFTAIEERHARLLDGTLDIIIALDPSARILSVNAAVTEQLGLSRVDLIDAQFTSLLVPADRPVFTRRLESVFDGETIRMDLQVRAGSGRSRTLATTGAPIRDAAGKPIAALCIARDVTEIRSEARRVAERELQLRLLVKSVNETVFTADRGARITAVYGRWFSGMSITIADLIGRTPVDVLGQRVGGEMLACMQRAMLGETAELEQELRIAGEKHSFRFWFTPLRDEDETTIIGVTGVAYDITAQRKAEQERDVLQASLEEARRTEAIGRLVAGIGHEINNPLAAILSFAEQLRAEARSPVDAAALEAIHAQAMRSRAIVRDLLAFVRPPSLMPITPVRVAPVFEDFVRALRPHTMSFGVELIAEPQDESVWITADVPAIEQAVMNLVINAAQLTPAGGTVRMRTVVSPSTYSIVVEDSGPGLSGEALQHLFEPFFTTKPVGQGTGLGLFVARGIAQRHGGLLRAENRSARDGGGARFTLDLPRTAQPPQAARDGAVSPPPARRPIARRGRILLVDDEAAIRTSLKRYFTRRDWDVFEAGDGEAALKVLYAEGAETFAMVLSDLRMPGMGGPAFHARVQQEFPRLIDRVVMVTGDVVSNEAAAFVSGTRSRVLEKPFELRVLASLAEELFASMDADGNETIGPPPA